MEKEKIILIGGGGHCNSCIDVIESTKKFEILGVIDMPEKVGQKVLDYKVIGSDNDIPELIKTCKSFVITLGQIESYKGRYSLYKKVKELGGNFPIIVSERAYVSKYATLGEGTIILHDALVNAGAKVGINCIINTKALIEHDAFVGDHCHVSTGAKINGTCRVEDFCFIGSGAVLKHAITIGRESVVGASVFVRKTLEARSFLKINKTSSETVLR